MSNATKLVKNRKQSKAECRNLETKCKNTMMKDDYRLTFKSQIHIQILQNHLHTFPWKISWENLLKDQEIFPLKFIL